MFSHLNFQTIGVRDVDRALAFYQGVLGLTVHTDDPYEFGDLGRWVMLEIPGARTKIHFGPQPGGAPSDLPALAIVVDDVDATCSMLELRGVEILQGPANAPWSPDIRWAMFRDSEQNLILIQTV